MKEGIEQHLAESVQALYATTFYSALSRPDPQFGEYASNIALQLAPKIGLVPREIAEALAADLNVRLADLVAEITIAGPGFINFRLKDSALQASLTKQVATPYHNQVVLVEYSDPNPFKPLHAGHLYTTLVGDVIGRLFELGGARVTRINYGGDVGLHVGKTMWAIIKAFDGENFSRMAGINEDERPDWLGQRYVEGNTAYEDDPTAKQAIIAINKRVYGLHTSSDHESEFAKIYWTGRQWSYDYFTRLYSELEVQAFDRILPESEIVDLAIKTVNEQLDAGVYERSAGAVIFDGEKHGLHTRVFINSAGLPTYEAKDVGLLMTKWRDYQFDRSIVITSNEQQQYMEVMLKSVAQFAPEPAARSRHLTHGVVKLRGGVKMSSRKGSVVRALDIIEAAEQANRALTHADNTATVLGAVKYAFLKNRIGGDIIYDPTESVSLEGNSGPYLQYAHARACGILKKVSYQAVNYQAIETLDTAERLLVRKLGEYSETLDKAVADLLPHHICGYLYELAQTFNRFYEQSRVIGDPRQAERLQLVSLYAETLKDGLALLGMRAPESI